MARPSSERGGDITHPDVPATVVDRAVEEFGGLDHLVTSAGGPPPGLLLDTDDEDWYDAYDLLIMSVVRAVRAAADHLREDGGGSFVAITSRTVKEASNSIVLSNSVRMAVIGLQKTLSRELAPEVRSNAVLPGSHETQRVRNLSEAAVERGEYADYDAAIASREADVPIGEIGDPQDFGNTVAYLCSGNTGYVNGVSLLIDGGANRSTL
jgi:3-oxoacyl-[acyl-carrier protein] reductase